MEEAQLFRRAFFASRSSRPDSYNKNKLPVRDDLQNSWCDYQHENWSCMCVTHCHPCWGIGVCQSHVWEGVMDVSSADERNKFRHIPLWPERPSEHSADHKAGVATQQLRHHRRRVWLLSNEVTNWQTPVTVKCSIISLLTSLVVTTTTSF